MGSGACLHARTSSQPYSSSCQHAVSCCHTPQYNAAFYTYWLTTGTSSHRRGISWPTVPFAYLTCSPTPMAPPPIPCHDLFPFPPPTLQRYHDGGGCDTPVTLVVNSTVVAASCADLDSVPVPRLYKIIFAYDVDPNVLGCFLVSRNPGGTLTQVVPPNGRNSAFACPGFGPHPTLPAPALDFFFSDPVAGQFTGLSGTLAVPGDTTAACGNAVAGIPFTGPYLPFADGFTGPNENVPKRELWAFNTTTTSAVVRGGPGPQTRQVRGVRHVGKW